MNPSEKRVKTPPSWLTKGALASGFIALLVSGILAIQLHNAKTDRERMSDALDAQTIALASIQTAYEEMIKLHRSSTFQIGALMSRVNELASQTSKSAATRFAEGDGEGDGATPQEKAATRQANNQERPRYTHFEIPQAGVEVWQNENGSIQARNDDPALTGTSIMVQAEDSDGNIRPMRIIIPPPGS